MTEPPDWAADISDVRRCVNQLRTAPARMSAEGLLAAYDALLAENRVLSQENTTMRHANLYCHRNHGAVPPAERLESP